jgi:hypothetical protein
VLGLNLDLDCTTCVDTGVSEGVHTIIVVRRAHVWIIPAVEWSVASSTGINIYVALILSINEINERCLSISHIHSVSTTIYYSN